MAATTTESGARSPSARPAALTKDDFSSLGGSYIKLGWHKSNAGSPDIRSFNESFIFHNQAPTLTSSAARQHQHQHQHSTLTGSNSSSMNAGGGGTGSGSGSVNGSGYGSGHGSGHGSGGMLAQTPGGFDPQGGLRGTKFGTGFSRRGQEAIENGAADEARSKMAQKEVLKGEMRANRSDSLRKLGDRSGFDVISHAQRGSGVAPTKQGKKRIEMVVSAEIAANSRIQLREGEGRFHMPHASGVGHEYRQQVLTSDGLTQPRFSFILQQGKADLPSYGTEDNFGKSRYPGGPPHPDSRSGLHELREAGKFTPRKQHLHPSGNAEIVRNWGSGIDLSNATLRGRLK